MKEQEDISDFFRNDDVKNYDIDKLWLDDMSQKLDDFNVVKKRKRAIFYLIIGLLTITAFSFFVFKCNGNDSIGQTIFEQNQTTKSIDENQLENTLIAKEKQNNKPSHHTQKYSDSNIENELINSNENLTTDNKYKTELNQVISGNLNLNTKHKSINKSSKKPIEGETLIEKEINLDQNIKSSFDNYGENSSSSISNKEEDLDKIIPIILSQNSLSNKGLNIHDSTLFNAASSSEKTENHDAIFNPYNNDSIVQEVPFDTLDENTDKSEEIDTNKTIEPFPILPKRKINSPIDKWSIGFVFGPDRFEKELTTTKELENFDQKNNEESYDNTWKIEFELNRAITNRFSASSGFGFKEYKEVNKYSSSSFTTSDTTYNIIDNSAYRWDTIFVDSFWYLDSTWIIDFDTISQIQTFTHIDSSKKAANGTISSKYIEIPLFVRYKFISKSKVSAYVDLGATISVLTKSVGKTLAYESNEIIDFKTKSNVKHATIGLGINFNIFGPLDYKIYGSYRKGMSSFSENPEVKKQYNGYSYRTGLVFKF